MEKFPCCPDQYHWFLDHPDRAVKVWKGLGAKCMNITDRGKGRFGWTDAQGSEIHWDTVYLSPQMRVWYAEGQVRPNALLPSQSIRAVVVLRYVETRDEHERPFMCHQAELYLHTSSVTAALAARLLGPSAPRLAEQYLSQLEMFFSVLATYCQQHPEQTRELVGDGRE
jgi:hypothetical protein